MLQNHINWITWEESVCFVDLIFVLDFIRFILFNNLKIKSNYKSNYSHLEAWGHYFNINKMTANKFWNENIATIKTLCIEITLNCAPNTASNFVTSQLYYNIKVKKNLWPILLYFTVFCMVCKIVITFYIQFLHLKWFLNYRKYV